MLNDERVHDGFLSHFPSYAISCSWHLCQTGEGSFSQMPPGHHQVPWDGNGWLAGWG